jgi:signal recognition particle receptor subunit beta
MALINHRAREVHLKIVYCGPGLGGKTTNLKQLHDRLPPERRGRLLSIATDHERTLFFDFLPLDLGTVNGFATRFHLYTVPGQVYYKLSRRAVLQGVDGVVFVADSHPAREAANRESLADMHQHLSTLGMSPDQLARMPRVFQWNKRDLPIAIPLERLRAALNPGAWPEFEAVASQGRGVSETLRAVCKAVLARLAMPAAPAAQVSAPGPVPRPAIPPAPAQVPVAGPAIRPAIPPAPAQVPRPVPSIIRPPYRRPA